MQHLHFEELKALLDQKADFYNQAAFIQNDPIQIPHLFTAKEDIEIAGLLVATIAWGQRKTILSNGLRMMQLMDNKPYEFVMHASAKALQGLTGFVHRTFNADDFLGMVHCLRHTYSHFGGLEELFLKHLQRNNQNMGLALAGFRHDFLQGPHLERTEKHVANVLTNSSAKRLNMYLRWMVRKDTKGVDFGLWQIPQNLLLCPLDVHSGRTARRLGILQRTNDDFKAVMELTDKLKQFDPDDPIKYDFALFGMGVNEGGV